MFFSFFLFLYFSSVLSLVVRTPISKWMELSQRARASVVFIIRKSFFWQNWIFFSTLFCRGWFVQRRCGGTVGRGGCTSLSIATTIITTVYFEKGQNLAKFDLSCFFENCFDLKIGSTLNFNIMCLTDGGWKQK